MPKRWYEDDDEYLAQRFPTFFGGADVYSEVSPYDAENDRDEYGFRRPRIGPARNGKAIRAPMSARSAKVSARPQSWLERLGGAMGQGYPNTVTPRQPVSTPPYVPQQQGRSLLDRFGAAMGRGYPNTVVPPEQQPARRPLTIGPTAGLGRRLPAGDYQDTNTPQRLTTPVPMDRRPASIGPNLNTGNPLRDAMTAARLNSNIGGGTPAEPSQYGEGASAIPNAMRIAMENARANSNSGRPGVFQAQGVNVPGSARVTNPMNSMRPMPSHGPSGSPVRAPGANYPAATRIAAAARRGIPSDVPMGPPPGGIGSPESSPIQSVPQQNPYEPPIGASGWTQNAPSPFLGREAPQTFGAWGKLDFNQQGGRNAGAESGSYPPGSMPTSPQEINQQPPNFDEGPQYNWDPLRRYNEYLNSEPDRKDYKPGKWGTILNAAKAGLYGYQTDDITAAHKFRQQLDEEPYQREIESWKRRGSGLARAAELEDKRYNIAGQDYNRRVDNARQQAELDLRKRTHMLADEKFRYDMGKDAMDMMMKGWQPALGENGKIKMIRMGPEGYEEFQTNNPNDKLTAAEIRSEAKARDESAMKRTRYSADSSAGSARAAIVSRESEGRLNRAHQTSENLLGRTSQERRTQMGQGVTEGTDYFDARTLLNSPDYKKLNASGIIKIYKGADGENEVNFTISDPKELEKKLEELSGGNPVEYRRLADLYANFQNYTGGVR